MGARLFVPRPVSAGPATATPSQSRLSNRPSSRLREAAALLLVAGALFLILALFSCRVTPGEVDAPTTWVGPTGGFIAHVLAQRFGCAA